MELDFLRQQHKSRHLERLAKMKLGTTVEKHAYSSTKSVERIVVLSEDETMVRIHVVAAAVLDQRA
eukprot:COSAG02_NODE_107_length_36312_cov_45.037942_31_plen_66_part_00